MTIRGNVVAVVLFVYATLWIESAGAAAVFSTGPFLVPEAITPAPDGSYLISDEAKQTVYSVSANGGAPTTNQAMGFRVFGETALTSYYGARQGQYLAYGTNSTSTQGVIALAGVNGLSVPSNVVSSNLLFANAAVAPTAFLGAAAGQIILTNAVTNGGIFALNANLGGTTRLAPGLAGLTPAGIGFAPAGFGQYGGDLFVSDTFSGNLYALDSSGNYQLFTTLPLLSPTTPGLRQFAWAPAGFGAADGHDYGGDLFVSVAAQHGGGGALGYVAVLAPTGQTVAFYVSGTTTPLDPRGLEFLGDDTTLLVANADPGVDSLVAADFLPASEVLPEPENWSIMLAGIVSLTALRYFVRRRENQSQWSRRLYCFGRRQ